jgi:hypothetical protein
MKRDRWLLRLAVDIDGGLMTPNKAYEELAAIRKVLEDAGYFILDHKGMCAPMSAEMLAALGSVKP